MIILVRFVHVTCSDGAYVADATSFTLTNIVKMNIPLSDKRGQGYDNGDNMKGKHSGLQK
ncbi:hypothetical protein PR048_016272 [Dryococelus australis]|uniref:Uncharacterized protein n=1 Tax=Dryococelus australis TaxID=614101 RepID=A0ABQ9HJ95_9NEOP|nr:hypothetical protein PR048_016272 [Dryococelus australis]